MNSFLKMYETAITDRFNGKFHQFFFDIFGVKYEYDLSRYFRSVNQLSKVEIKLISLCSGRILDVGCGTCYYFPLLEMQGDVLGIDISPKVIEVAKKLGIHNCYVANIFSFGENEKYDTITLFENNLGMGGSVEQTAKLLGKLRNLLKERGQILAILSARINGVDYVEFAMTPIYNDTIGKSFNWINFNTEYLSKICGEEGLKLKTICANKYFSLIKISKIN